LTNHWSSALSIKSWMVITNSSFRCSVLYFTATHQLLCNIYSLLYWGQCCEVKWNLANLLGLIEMVYHGGFPPYQYQVTWYLCKMSTRWTAMFCSMLWNRGWVPGKVSGPKKLESLFPTVLFGKKVRKKMEEESDIPRSPLKSCWNIGNGRRLSHWSLTEAEQCSSCQTVSSLLFLNSVTSTEGSEITFSGYNNTAVNHPEYLANAQQLHVNVHAYELSEYAGENHFTLSKTVASKWCTEK